MHLKFDHFNPIIFLFFICICCIQVTVKADEFDDKALLDFALLQYNRLAPTLKPTDFIHTGDPFEDHWETNDVTKWTVGFYPATLWMLYKLTGDTKWKNLAMIHTEAVKSRQYDVNTHDVGFVIHSTYGLALEYADSTSEEFKSVIVNASISMSSRFHELAGCIRSWNNDEDHGGMEGEVKVIADNMMNLELLFIASQISGNTRFRDIAYSHAVKTSEEHLRADGGSFHAVAFNETTGDIERKYTWQGYADDSTWARGQAWLIHGFASCYKYNKTQRFLQTAERTASYFIRNLPEDNVPFWDFNSPFDTEYQPRDTSAAAVAASGLLDLYKFTENATYLDTAVKIMNGLNEFRADGRPGYKIPAILVNGTVFYKENRMNTAIVYGDYYLLQAVHRYREITGTSSAGLMQQSIFGFMFLVSCSIMKMV